MERFATALQIPLYQLFYTDDAQPSTPNLTPRKSLEELVDANGKGGTEARFLMKLQRLLDHIADSDRELLLTLAKKLSAR
jgi:hypothetical protein